MKNIKQIAAAAERCQCGAFAAARIADHTGAAFLLQKLRQPVTKFRVVAGRDHLEANLAEEGRIVNSLMRFTVTGNQTGTIHGKNGIQMHQRNIMDQLVICALEKGGVNGHHGQHSLAGKSACKGYRMFFGHAHIEKALRISVIKEL